LVSSDEERKLFERPEDVVVRSPSSIQNDYVLSMGSRTASTQKMNVKNVALMSLMFFVQTVESQSTCACNSSSSSLNCNTAPGYTQTTDGNTLHITTQPETVCYDGFGMGINEAAYQSVAVCKSDWEDVDSQIKDCRGWTGCY
jgi:hypothetical protein